MYARIELSNVVVSHSRQVYNILDLLGYYGGLAEVVTVVFAFLVGPLAEHSFLLKAIKKLYFVKTSDSTLFAQPKS